MMSLGNVCGGYSRGGYKCGVAVDAAVENVQVFHLLNPLSTDFLNWDWQEKY